MFFSVTNILLFLLRVVSKSLVSIIELLSGIFHKTDLKLFKFSLEGLTLILTKGILIVGYILYMPL
jgi:hypothetical protein